MIARLKDYRKEVNNLLSHRLIINDNIEKDLFTIEEDKEQNKVKFVFKEETRVNIDSIELITDYIDISTDQFIFGHGEEKYVFNSKLSFLEIVKMMDISEGKEEEYHIDINIHKIPSHIKEYDTTINNSYPIFHVETDKKDDTYIGNVYAYLHPLSVEKVRITNINKSNLTNVLNTASVVIDDINNSTARDIGFTRCIINRLGNVFIIDSCEDDEVTLHMVGKKDKSLKSDYLNLARMQYYPVDSNGIMYNNNDKKFIIDDESSITEEVNGILDKIEKVIGMHDELNITELLKYVDDVLLHGHLHDEDLDLIKRANNNINEYISFYLNTFDIETVADNSIHEKIAQVPEFIVITKNTDEDDKPTDAELLVFNKDYMYNIWGFERATSELIEENTITPDEEEIYTEVLEDEVYDAEYEEIYITDSVLETQDSDILFGN